MSWTGALFRPCVPRPTIHPPTPARAQALLKAADGHLMGLRRERLQKLMQLATGQSSTERGFVLTTRTGKPLDGSNVRRAFKKLLIAAGLPSETRIYDLRQAMAIMWLAQGVPDKVVSQRLGHASMPLAYSCMGTGCRTCRPRRVNRWT
jgi:integrase